MIYYYKNKPVELIAKLSDGECVIQFDEEVLKNNGYTTEGIFYKFVVPQNHLTKEPIDYDKKTKILANEVGVLENKIKKLERQYTVKEEDYKRKLGSIIETVGRMQKSFETLCSLTKQQQEKYDNLTQKIKDIEGE